MRILWIDDEVSFLRIQARILRAYHEVRTVMTAGEAFAVLAVEKFDVILCDVNLPGMSGPVFFERLSFEERAQIIFVTGGGSGGDAAFLAEHRTLMKPFSREELLGAIGEIGVAGPARAANG